jgi:hypothetical protein
MAPAVRQLIRKGETIDISEIEDDEVRDIVKELMSFMLLKSTNRVVGGRPI